MTNSVYDPQRHRPEIELRLANAALLNAAINFVADAGNPSRFAQLGIETKNVVRLRELDPFLSLTFSETTVGMPETSYRERSDGS